jgi:hypothetical protein
METPGKVRRIAAWVLTGLLFLLFAASATGKLVRADAAVETFGKWGLGDYILLIGAGELISAVLFLIPRTTSAGLLLLSSYMGGAIVSHMQHGESFVGPSVILVLVWVAGYLRHPEILQSFRGNGAAVTVERESVPA